MNILLIIIEHEKERELLRMFLEQSKYHVILSKPTFSNYIKSLQYKPNLVLIEIPHNYSSHIGFINMIKKNKRTKKIPVIGYGSHADDFILQTFKSKGIDVFYRRPLKTSVLIKSISKFVPVKVDKKQESQEVKDKKLDIKSLLDPNTKPMTKIEIITNYVQKMLAFPFTVAKVLKVTQSDQTGANDLAKAIQADPVITATILKVANSVLFASRGKRIANIKDAIVRIGFKETKNIAMSLSVLKLFSKEQKTAGFDRISFWYHSLACAVVSEKIAKNCKYPDPEEAFISGLLHDFGILILDEFFNELLIRSMEITTRHGSSFIEEEKKLLKIDHNDVASELFKKWKMPDNVVFAVKNFNSCSSLDENLDKNTLVLTQAISIAHKLVKTQQIGSECDSVVDIIENECLKKIKYPNGIKKDFWDDILNQLNFFNSFLKIDDSKLSLPDNAINDSDKIKIAKVDRSKMVYNVINEYLLNEGYSIIPVESREEIEVRNHNPDIIIIYPDKKDSFDMFNSFMSIPKKDDKKKMVPLIMFVGNDYEIKEIYKEGSVKVINYKTDLRKLDHQIGQIVFGYEEEKETFLDLYNKYDNHDFLILDAYGHIVTKYLMKFKEHLMEILKDNEIKNVVVDMKEVEHVDSSGLGIIENFNKRLEQKKCKLVLINISEKVNNIFKVSKLDKVVAIKNDQNEASKYLNESLEKQKQT